MCQVNRCRIARIDKMDWWITKCQTDKKWFQFHQVYTLFHSELVGDVTTCTQYSKAKFMCEPHELQPAHGAVPVYTQPEMPLKNMKQNITYKQWHHHQIWGATKYRLNFLMVFIIYAAVSLNKGHQSFYTIFEYKKHYHHKTRLW